MRQQRSMKCRIAALGFWLWVLSAPLAAAERTLLVLGDSLSAAYGLQQREGWVALLEPRLGPRGWRVVNASISGETSAGGRARIAGELARHRPALLLLALGANDGLRGLPIAHTEANLAAIIGAAKAAGARVLLVGIRIPPNYGPEYTEAFFGLYARLAQAHAVPLLPFLLEPIALDRDAFLPDQLHPNAAAQPKLAEHVWAALAPLLESDHGEAAAAQSKR